MVRVSLFCLVRARVNINTVLPVVQPILVVLSLSRNLWGSVFPSDCVFPLLCRGIFRRHLVSVLILPVVAHERHDGRDVLAAFSEHAVVVIWFHLLCDGVHPFDLRLYFGVEHISDCEKSPSARLVHDVEELVWRLDNHVFRRVHLAKHFFLV